jgi:NAD(P)-dependent dehydrogenase (short-subunit alcohol dehydrogenase family)
LDNLKHVVERESAMSKVWMVTGASRGLGLEVAKAALKAGNSVVATARRADAILKALGAQDGLLAVDLDVKNSAQAELAVAKSVERFGHVDVLVNNAGYGHLGPFEEATGAELEEQYAVNVFGAMHVTRAVLPGMRKRREGRIFNISSIAGLTGGANASLYCSSKFALEGWSESLAAELQPLGIWVTAVEPGFFRTDFLDASSIRYTQGSLPEYREGMEQLQGWMTSKNHKQEGDPAKLAQILLDLASRQEQPLHLPLGTDAVAWMESRIDRDRKAVDDWKAVSISTDYPI